MRNLPSTGVSENRASSRKNHCFWAYPILRLFNFDDFLIKKDTKIEVKKITTKILLREKFILSKFKWMTFLHRFVLFLQRYIFVKTKHVIFGKNINIGVYYFPKSDVVGFSRHIKRLLILTNGTWIIMNYSERSGHTYFLICLIEWVQLQIYDV